MTRHEIRLRLTPGQVTRSYPSWLEWPRLLIPYRLRSVHRWWAQLAGFFWQPCPLCDKPFGGHEWRDINGKPSSVPDPTNPPLSVGICPPCTRAGRGVRA